MASPPRTNLRGRYELREELGKGGMGIVYRAWDSVMQRDVALKTILDIDNPQLVDMFYKEWGVLASMIHPNVISIYDVGEFEHEGSRKPFFVMPLLPGATLDKLIRDGSPRLNVDNVVAMIEQAARGLQAAHEHALVHGDIKPSNIFVLDDDTVKIIDFGIARSASRMTKTSLKGTLAYLAPEQLKLTPATAQSDLYSLAVSCYEALTRRKAFRGATEEELGNAILHSSPPPATEINPNVKFAVSQVLHKAMAKSPWHRFATALEFGDALRKAHRGEALEFFDTTQVKARLERATDSFEKGEHTFAAELLSELEGEGHLNPEIELLRRRIDETLRQTRIRQFLESARRFFEAEEYALALRKVQDALDIDPQGLDALALKNQIEGVRRQKKIGEWIGLARQHLANNAFRQAREALENVLKVKSTDQDALNLMAEVRRQEQEFDKAREAKAELFQSARRAWEQGDMTQALSKLQVLIKLDKQSPEGDTARSSTYQSFYNHVHSEYDSLKHGYDEAKKHLAADRLDEARRLCDQFLTKYPNHALFQALKFDVEERQRQQLSALIAETDRRVEEEADLDKRVAILEESLRQYPGEPHLERALRLTRDKRDLVNSIVAKARLLEERGQMQESVDQWQILRSIHDRYPGLQFEIERLIQRRDQQAQENAKADWIKRIDHYLEEADYDRAEAALTSAMGEFPSDVELTELGEVVRKSRERGEQSKALLEQARTAREEGESAKGLDLLRQAQAIEPRNPVIRTVLIATLLEDARPLITSSPDTAEGLLNEVLALEEGNVPARALLAQISQNRQEVFIAWCLAQARHLQGDGDLTGALAIVSQGLQQHGNDERLLRLKLVLERARASESPRTVSNLNVAPKGTETQAIASKRPEPKPEAGPKAAGPSAATPTSQAAARPTVANAFAGFLSALSKAFTRLRRDWLPAAREKANSVYSLASAAVRRAYLGASNSLGTIKLPPAMEPHRARLVPIAIGVIVLLVAALLVTRTRSHKPIVTARQVSIETSEAEAEILVDGKYCSTGLCTQMLASGSHTVEARLLGYQPASVSVDVAGVDVAPVRLSLIPVPPLLLVTSDLNGAKLSVDGRDAGEVQGADIEVKDLAWGEHTLILNGNGTRIEAVIAFKAGASPTVTSLKGQGVKAFLTAGLGPNTRVVATASGIPAKLDGNPVADVTEEGLLLKGIPQGAHELSLEAKNEPVRRIPFESGNRPYLTATVVSGTQTGLLRITTGEDDVLVTVSGSRRQVLTRQGRAIFGLAPGQYTVHAEKPGFLPVPDQLATVKLGEESRVEMKIVAAPRKATLSIHGGVAGTEVTVDGRSVGNVGGDGEFSFGDIDPGRRVIVLRRENYRERRAETEFTAGTVQQIDGALQTLLGTLRIDLTPPGTGANITIRREGDPGAQPVTESSLSLTEGTYRVSASARGFLDQSVLVRVNAGSTAAASINLRRVEQKEKEKEKEKAPPVQVASLGLADIERLGGWTRAGSSLERRGGEDVLFPALPGPGVVEFQITWTKGRRHEFLAGWRDARNYVHYELDERELKRTDVVNGKKTEGKQRINLDRNGPNRFRFSITPEAIQLQWQNGAQGGWQSLDQLTRAGANFSAGRVGLHVPSRDEVRLLEFQFLP